ncbi:MAG: hypothetical protein ABFS08_12295 [Pseudomonadota bacterium]
MNKENILKIAHSIEHVTQLPSDDSFVNIIGDGTEKNNLEAMHNWVARQDDLLNLEPAQYRLEKLIQRLRATIEDLYGDIRQ